MEWPQCFLKKYTRWIEWEHMQVEKALRKQGPHMVWVSPSLHPQELLLCSGAVKRHDHPAPMCSCMCVSLCVSCVYAHVYVCLCMYVCLWMYSCMSELCFVFVNYKCFSVWCVYVHVCVCRCVFMHVHIYTCVYLCMHVCEACIMGVFICLSHLLICKLSDA